MRKRLLPILMVSILILTLSGGEVLAGKHGWGKGIKGSGDVETRELDFDGFDEIRLDGAFDVEITFGRGFDLKLTTDDNLFGEMDIYVEDDRLVLDTEENLRPTEGVLLEITMPDLVGLKINGAGDILIEGFDGERFELNVRGAGDLTIDGRVGSLEVNISGAGDVDAEELVAREVEIGISGAGDATVHATESLKARVSGVGNITYYGDPEHKRTKVSGLGHIKGK